MTDTLKVLGQQLPAAATLTPLYTVPAVTSTALSSVVICNEAGATTFRLSVAVAGAADATKQYLYYDLPLAANDTFIATVGLTLGVGDVIRCQSASGSVAFSAFGDEVT